MTLLRADKRDDLEVRAHSAVGRAIVAIQQETSGTKISATGAVAE